MNYKRGFTLLELIIVIIVIGILASIALPKYGRVAERTRVAEAKSMLSAIRNAQYRYYIQYSMYATRDNIDSLDIEVIDGKYFNFTIPNEPYFSAGWIGQATRLDYQRGDYGEYYLHNA